MPDPWRAGLVLVGVCVLVSLPRPPEPLPACALPGLLEREPVPGVVCDDPRAPLLTGPARRLFGLPIDLNRADAATLTSLPGIGPQRARAILAERPFRAVQELRRVPGIGPVLAARVAPFVTVGRASVGTSPRPRKPGPRRTDSLHTSTRR